MTVAEPAKASGGGVLMRTAAATDLVRVAMRNSAGDVDYAVVQFRTGATKAFDASFDAHKLNGSVLNVSSLGSDQVNMSINKRPMLASVVDSIPMKVEVYSNGQYSFAFTEMESFTTNAKVYLHDRFTGTTQQITLGFTYDFVVNSDARTQGKRFVLIAVPEAVTGIDEHLVTEQFTLFPNPGSRGAEVTALIQGIRSQGSLSIEVIDAAGRRVHMESFNSSDLVDGKGTRKLDVKLGGGVYTVRLLGKGRVMNQKLVIQ